MNDKFLELQQFYTYVVLNTETKNECENYDKKQNGSLNFDKAKVNIMYKIIQKI